jgi:hypothetical protein
MKLATRRNGTPDGELKRPRYKGTSTKEGAANFQCRTE